MCTMLAANDTADCYDPKQWVGKDRAFKTLEDAKQNLEDTKRAHLEALEKLKAEAAEKLKEVEEEARKKVKVTEKTQRETECAFEKLKASYTKARNEVIAANKKVTDLNFVRNCLKKENQELITKIDLFLGQVSSWEEK